MRIETLADGVSDRWVTIYALCEPIDRWKTGRVRYVGKTVQTVWHRVRSHACAANKPQAKRLVLLWLKKHIEAGNPFHIRHLEQVPPGKDWAIREQYWIAKFREEGDLLNMTDGGEGLCGHVMSDEHKQKIASALRSGSTFSCLKCGCEFWRKLNEIAQGHNKFCSRECAKASLKGVSRPVPPQFTAAGIAGAAFAKRAQTHCKRGHALAGKNLFLTSQGGRVCKECRKIHKLTYRAKGGK